MIAILLLFWAFEYERIGASEQCVVQKDQTIKCYALDKDRTWSPGYRTRQECERTRRDIARPARDSYGQALKPVWQPASPCVQLPESQ